MAGNEHKNQVYLFQQKARIFSRYNFQSFCCPTDYNPPPSRSFHLALSGEFIRTLQKSTRCLDLCALTLSLRPVFSFPTHRFQRWKTFVNLKKDPTYHVVCIPTLQQILADIASGGLAWVDATLGATWSRKPYSTEHRLLTLQWNLWLR